MVPIARKSLIAFLAALCVMVSFPCGAAEYSRIISLYAGHTENMIALGGTDRIIALSTSDESLPDLPRFTLNTGPEAILALKPDLVLVRSLVKRHNPELINVLRRAGVTVELIDPPSWEGFPEYLQVLAPFIGASPDEAVARFYASCEEIRDEAERRRAGRPAPKVFVEATSREYHTPAPGSWAARLIELAGGINAAATAVPRRGSSIAPWGLERVLSLLSSGLDVYIIQSGAMNNASLQDVQARPWADALKNTRLVQIPEALLSRPSLIGLTEGGHRLIEILYGE